MKRILIGFFVLLSALALISMLFSMHQSKDSSVKSFKIAIFTPITHAALEEIEHDFKSRLSEKNKDLFTVTVFNANGNKTLQRAQAEEIINGTYDLIFSIATSCTQLIAEIAKKKGTHVPQVFCSIEDPVGMGIVKSLASSGNHITGVIENPTDYGQILTIMRRLKPEIKNILLVYDPGVNFSMEREKKELEHIFEKSGVLVHSIEISQANEIQQKVTGLISNKDFVLVLKDNTVVSGIDSLITLCNRYGTPLFVSDLNSGKKGAAIAYGIREGDSGVGAAQKALQVLVEHKKPTDIAITPVEKLRLIINKKAMLVQKLSLDPALLMAIEQNGSLKELQ